MVAAFDGTPGYFVTRAAPADASLEAAVTAAAHTVLSYLYPGQQAALDARRAAVLAAIPEGAAKTAGIAFGTEIANLIIALRSADGFNDFETFDGSTAVGKCAPPHRCSKSPSRRSGRP